MGDKLEEGLSKSAERVTKHMNEDHADSLLAYAHFYGGLPAQKAVMTGLNAHGFVLDVTLTDGSVQRDVLIPYEPPLTTAADVRKVAVRMHFAAYGGLGFAFKVRNGFYSGAAKQAWTHLPARIRLSFLGILAAVTSGIAFGSLRRMRLF